MGIFGCSSSNILGRTARPIFWRTFHDMPVFFEGSAVCLAFAGAGFIAGAANSRRYFPAQLSMHGNLAKAMAIVQGVLRFTSGKRQDSSDVRSSYGVWNELSGAALWRALGRIHPNGASFWSLGYSSDFSGGLLFGFMAGFRKRGTKPMAGLEVVEREEIRSVRHSATALYFAVLRYCGIWLGAEKGSTLAGPFASPQTIKWSCSRRPACILFALARLSALLVEIISRKAWWRFLFVPINYLLFMLPFIDREA